jgi:ketosteroid isomerase-like protein
MRIAILSLCLFASHLFAAPEQVTTLEQDYLNTRSSNDAEVANDILHADYVYVGVDGERHDRAWSINMIGSGQLVYESVTISRGPIHDLGDVVITLGRMRAPGTWAGKPMLDHLAFTMVWVRVEGQWKLLSEHNSKVMNGQ